MSNKSSHVAPYARDLVSMSDKSSHTSFVVVESPAAEIPSYIEPSRKRANIFILGALLLIFAYVLLTKKSKIDTTIDAITFCPENLEAGQKAELQ